MSYRGEEQNRDGRYHLSGDDISDRVYRIDETEQTVYHSDNIYQGYTTNDDNSRTYRTADYQTGYYEQPKKNTHWVKALAKAVCFALVFGVVAGAGFAGSTTVLRKITSETKVVQDEEDGTITPETLTSEQAEISNAGANTQSAGVAWDVSQVAENVMPSIVSITTISTQRMETFFGFAQEYESEGCGSGIIVSEDDEYLYIATNNHVVAGAKTVSVTFVDDTTIDATVKGKDPSSDLAVVEVKLDDIKGKTRNVIRAATFGDSTELKAGQATIAIGNALGYGQSVTTGVVSALDREVTVQDEETGNPVTNQLIQTDAAINPGNSGGALLNLRGEVIGINSVKYSETSVEGMGYAIPVKTAVPIIEQLITREVVSGRKSAYLGISGVDVTSDVAGTYNMPQGVYVAQVVEGSGAEKAGILQGDIITKFDGRNVKSMEEIQELLKYLAAGDTVEVIVSRANNGEFVEEEFQVELGTKK